MLADGEPFADLYDTVVGADVAQVLDYQVGDEIIIAHGLVSTDFVGFDIFATKRTNKVDRSFRKVDDMLSYAGGLFGLIMGFLAFLFSSYSEYCYELYVAESTFKHDPDFKESSFGFFSYIGYQFWEFLGNFCCQPNIKRFKAI